MTDKCVSVWILGDQLVDDHPALAAAVSEHGRAAVRVVMVESMRRTRRMPYHRKKLVLLFSAMRHYAERLRSNGFSVDYHRSDTFVDGLRAHVNSHAPARLYTMSASAYGGRRFQRESLAEAASVPLTLLPNSQFLVGKYDPYPDPEPGKRYVMEYFYRDMRRHFDLLLDAEGEPAGGEWNYDKQNRKPLPTDAAPPELPGFAPDEITQTVIDEIEAAGLGFGELEGFDLAVTHEQAQAAFDDFVRTRLANFGAYEDAMSREHAYLWHSVLSPYLNLGLLEPLALARAAETAYYEGDAPINSVEGFIRQVVGWREYMYWQYWRCMPELMAENFWQADRPLPGWFWDGKTDMECLRRVLARVVEHGYVHHIERLMVLSNFSLLAGLNPQAVNEWFTGCFIDAYEWVMAPNVLGMGLNADGGVIATKPYIASANYINKMSDYCPYCHYDHKQRVGADACPFNSLYWRFLIRNEETLRSNPRLGRNVLGLRHLDEAERKAVIEQSEQFLADL